MPQMLLWKQRAFNVLSKLYSGTCDSTGKVLLPAGESCSQNSTGKGSRELVNPRPAAVKDVHPKARTRSALAELGALSLTTAACVPCRSGAPVTPNLGPSPPHPRRVPGAIHQAKGFSRLSSCRISCQQFSSPATPHLSISQFTNKTRLSFNSS